MLLIFLENIRTCCLVHIQTDNSIVFMLSLFYRLLSYPLLEAVTSTQRYVAYLGKWSGMIYCVTSRSPERTRSGLSKNLLSFVFSGMPCGRKVPSRNMNWRSVYNLLWNTVRTCTGLINKGNPRIYSSMNLDTSMFCRMYFTNNLDSYFARTL